MNESTQQPVKNTPRTPDWLRWTLPPGVSIAVHALLIGAIAYIGMQISATESSPDALPIAELALPAPRPVTQEPVHEQPLTAPSPDAASAANPSYTTRLDDAAANLGDFELSKPAMDPIALAALRSSHAQIASPQSVAPPTVRFAGMQTRAARTIVYVVDGSGATANSFAYLQSQLLRSIDRLSPTQRFQVVLFRAFDDTTMTFAPINHAKLARATRQNKALVADWLKEINARGRSNPLVGLKAALELDPDLVLLITRSIQRTEMGWAQGQREILAQLNTHNPLNPKTGKRPTIIKTIQLLDEDPTGIMRAIGTFHGDGTDDYRVVSYDDLISPDDADSLNDLSTRSLGASNEQRISSANELMGTLSSSGTSFSVFYAYADKSQQERARMVARQIRSLVRPLVGVDGRAAILDAQASLMLGIVDPGSITTSELESIVAKLDPMLYTEPNTDAQRVLSVALAMVQLGQIDQARRRVSELIELADDLGLDDSTRAQSLIALASMGPVPDDFEAMVDTPPFITPTGGIDAVWGLLLRETITRARLEYALPEPWNPMISIRRAARYNPSIRNYIDSRIALVLESNLSESNQTDSTQADSTQADSNNTDSIADLPSVVLLAAANTMSHTMDQRERAMELFESIADRHGDPEQAGDALWQIGVLGRAINTKAARARSAWALTELAKRYPTSRRAPDAIAGAINATPAHEEALARDRLGFGVARFPDHLQIDLWRLALAELLTDFAALDVLDPITPDTREGVLAGQLYEQTVLGMLDRYTDPQIRRGLGIRMRDAAKRFDIPGAQMWTKRAAMSEIELDPEAAIGSIDQLIAEAIEKNQPTDELELMRAQTLETLGQSRTAFDALRRLSTRIDATGNHTSTYWQAWALMLETIVERGSSQEKADALGHIARLELIDSNLGGSPWQQRIIAVRQTLHSSP